jgi:hypothetical protein
MNFMNTNRSYLALICAAALFFPAIGRCQQGSQSSPPAQTGNTNNAQTNPSDNPKANSQNPANSTGSNDAAPIPTVLMNDDTPPIRKIGSASLLDSASILRWGDLYVGSADYSQVYSTIDPRTGAAIANNASLFRTHLFYDHQFQKARLALQYQPRLMIIDGNVIADLVNQDISLDSYVRLSSRWILGFGNRFTYYGSKDAFAEDFLDANSVTATTIQNNSLQGSGTWLSNSVGGSLNYLWSPRTKISISPSYTYSHSSTSINDTQTASVSNESISSNGYGVRTSVTYDWTASRSIGAYYYFQYITSPTAFSSTAYHEMGASISQRFTPTFAVSGSAGATTAAYSSGREWDSAFSLSAIKSFGLSNVSLAYSRGQTLTGYVTNHLGERVDASAVRSWSRRFQTNVGAGYEREITHPIGLWAKYAHVNVSYRLTAQMSIFSSFVHLWQNSSDPQLFTGGSNFVVVGIGWSPMRTNETQ